MKGDMHRPPSTWFLYVAAWFAQLCMGILGIAVPIYAYTLGASPLLIGLIGASGGITYSIMPMVFGKISDRLVGGKPIFVAMLSYGFTGIFYAHSEDPLKLVFIKVIEWASLALFWPTVEALIADTTGEEAIDEALERFNVSWGSAMVLGPFVGGLLISWWTVKLSFYVSSATAFSLGIMSLLSTGRTLVKQKVDMHSTDQRSTDLSVENRGYVPIALMSTFLFSFGVGILTSLFPAFATHLGIPAYEIGLITLVFALTRVLAFSQAKNIESRLKKEGVFLSSSMIFASSFAMMAGGSTTPIFTLCFAALGCGAGMAYSASISFILCEWGLTRGYAAGIFESLIGFGYFVGPLVGGMASEISLQGPYILGALLSAVICLIQLGLLKKGA